MSTAAPVPETYGLDGETAVATLKRAKVGPLMRDSVARLRWADGFSHARAMAFQSVLAMIPGAIVLVALATKLHWEALSTSIVRMTRSLAPGPASDVFADAFGQGAKAGNAGSGSAALVFGGLALLISGATAYGQIERAANRIYGVEADRPTLRKYALATGLMLTSGLLIVLGFLIIGLGEEWADHADVHAFDTVWEIGRWPLAAVGPDGRLRTDLQAVTPSTSAEPVVVGVRRTARRARGDHRLPRLPPVPAGEQRLRQDLRPTRRLHRRAAVGVPVLHRAVPRPGVRRPTGGSACR